MKHTKLLLVIFILCASLLLSVACNKNEDEAGSDVTTLADAIEDYEDDSTEEAVGSEEDASTSSETTATSSDETTDVDVESDSESSTGFETTEKTTTTESTTSSGSSEETTTKKPEVTTSKKEDDVVVASKVEKTFNKTITVGAGGAVSTRNGLSYTASGYSSVNGNRFVIGTGTLTVNFNNNFTDKYNKFIICYESTTPVKGTVTYLSSGRYITDEFFLEAGSHTFSCLNTGYLDAQYGVNLQSMTFKSITGSCEFGLYDLETENYQIFDNEIYYIDTAMYKVGIKLSWGGGICFIRDKAAYRTDKLSNLINQCDTGRLVQQSYYGTNGDSKYTAGYYNGSKWCYNPVQGGDVEQNHSRIIDIVIEDQSVYVKSQPQDWAKDNQITPSYMENVYTVYNDRIQVDNRFVDFSFYTNHNRDQELPAFYTISYLDTFVYYDGSQSWTDANLAYKGDLPFWGDNNVRNNCLFPLRQSNTETWCAWVNNATDYGIGLYVPNVDFFLAGRFGYNGSKDPYDGATNYVAPINKLTLVSGDPIEYSYIITTGSVSKIRDTFKQYKDFAANESLHKNYESKRIPDEVGGGSTLKFDFSQSSGLGYLEDSNNANIAYDATQGAVKLTSRGGDPHVRIMLNSFTTPPVANNYKKVTIRYMVPTSSASAGSGGFELFLSAGTTTIPEAGKSVRGNYVSDGQWREVTIDLSKLSYWTGNINFLRFDFFNNCGSGATIFVKSIEFHN